MGKSKATGPPSAEGLLLAIKKDHTTGTMFEYALGPALGSGAQGTVHEIVQYNDADGAVTPIPFIAKVVPVPTGKSKKSDAHTNSISLSLEYQCYSGALDGVRQKKNVIPMLPVDDYDGVAGKLQSFYDNIEGFRVLVLERLDKDFFSLVPLLVDEARTTKSSSINVGIIGRKLIQNMRSIHDAGVVFVDVKPDNIMLAPPCKARKCRSTLALDSAVKDLASRLRLFDLGCAKRYGSREHHCGNKPSADGLQAGTPTYASLHALDGNTTSCRDDMFAIVLIIAELVLRLHAEIQGEARPPHLPWASESSEAALAEMKDQMCTNRASKFYKSMPNEESADIIFNCLQHAHALDFKDEPDYDGLQDLVFNLRVPVVAAARRTPTKKTAKGTRSTRNSTSSSDKKPTAIEIGEDGSTESTPRRSTRRSTSKSESPSASSGTKNKSRKTTTSRAGTTNASSAKTRSSHPKNTSDLPLAPYVAPKGTSAPTSSARTTAAAATATKSNRKTGTTKTSGESRELRLAPFVAPKPARAASKAPKTQHNGTKKLPSTNPRRSKRNRGDDDPKSPNKSAKTESDFDEDEEMEEAGAVEEYVEDDPMEVDENEDATVSAKAATTVRNIGGYGLLLRIASGQDVGKTFYISGTKSRKILSVGSQKGADIALSKVTGAVSNHAKFTCLFVRNGRHHIEVTNLAGGTTAINRMQVSKGSSRAWRGDRIKIGETELVVSLWENNASTVAAKENVVHL